MPIVWTPSIVRAPQPVIDGALRALRRERVRWRHVRDPRLDPILERRCAIVVVQSKEFTGTYPINSGAVAFDSNNAAGNLIAVCVTHYNGAANHTMSVSDTVGNTYQTGIAGQGSGNYQARLFYAMNIGAGANTVTVDVPDGNSDLWFSITEIAGCLTAAALDVSNAASGTSTTPTVSLTTTQADTIGVAVFTHEVSGTDHAAAQGSGWTLIHEQDGGGTVMPGLSEYQIFTSAGAKTADGTIDASGQWHIVAAAFKAAEAGAGGGGSAKAIGSRLRPRPFAPGLAR